ncbi:MAG: phosphoribosylformylglycinamidine synthase subunit PurQ [Proteobacteria bacterium]|nr:phosphoribosylformylglycinamidine synthase subunit PurQ [Pseudomonadota bacterium]MDA1023455.1 phosphoribosylformylglycinamidine synthase subunit PurQ [Pseudomonadota bacterium]
MKSCVIVFPGSNCDRDIQVALRQSMGSDPLMVWHGDASIPEVDLIAVPGGFSYGDYLRSGAMAAQSPIMKDVVAKAKKGVPVLGICNGFQVLTECGLLPGVLMRNAGLKFVCKDIYLRTEAADTPFTQGYAKGQVIRIPVAHHDGNYFTDDDTLARLKGEDRIAFRYVNAEGKAGNGSNPNGSLDDIAGILNEKRTVLGMMPHPERLADQALGGDDGRPMFDGLIAALA